MISAPVMCHHKFSDGTICDCVANHATLYCRWHRTAADRQRRTQRVVRRSRHKPISFTIASNPKVAQHNIQQVLDALLSNRISDRRAGVLLYAIATTIYS
jgi:hypothetical protein